MENKLKFYRFEKCFLCNGMGTIEIKAHKSGMISLVKDCVSCDGRGELQIEMDLDKGG
mgnify:CR=1 FL=1